MLNNTMLFCNKDKWGTRGG